MKAQLKILVLALLVLALASCATPTPVVIEREVIVTQEVEVPVEVEVQVEVPAEIQSVRVNMGYIPDMQFAPFYVGIEQGFFADEGINIIPDFSAESDGYALVGAGTIPFAVGAGDSLMQARANGLPIVMVARWYNGTPSAIVSMKESGIETPADLVGKTLGLPGFYSINYKTTLAMLDANGLTTDDVTLEAIGWTQIAAVSEGLVDAAVVYSNNEPIQMQWAGMDVSVMELDQYADFVPIGIHTSEDVIANDPELVTRFVRAFLRSVKFSVDNPDEALAASMRALGVYGWESSKAEMALSKSLEFWAPVDGLYGYYDDAPFIWSQDFLLKIGDMDTATDVTKAYTNEFVDAAGQP